MSDAHFERIMDKLKELSKKIVLSTLRGGTFPLNQKSGACLFQHQSDILLFFGLLLFVSDILQGVVQMILLQVSVLRKNSWVTFQFNRKKLT